MCFLSTYGYPDTSSQLAPLAKAFLGRTHQLRSNIRTATALHLLSTLLISAIFSPCAYTYFVFRCSLTGQQTSAASVFTTFPSPSIHSLCPYLCFVPDCFYGLPHNHDLPLSNPHWSMFHIEHSQNGASSFPPISCSSHPNYMMSFHNTTLAYASLETNHSPRNPNLIKTAMLPYHLHHAIVSASA